MSADLFPWILRCDVCGYTIAGRKVNAKDEVLCEHSDGSTGRMIQFAAKDSE